MAITPENRIEQILAGENITPENRTENFVKGAIDQAGELPSMSGQSGKFLTNNGTAASWSSIPTELPSQTSQSGKFLTTDGSATSWASIPAELPTTEGASVGAVLTITADGLAWVAPASQS